MMKSMLSRGAPLYKIWKPLVYTRSITDFRNFSSQLVRFTKYYWGLTSQGSWDGRGM